MDTLTKTGWALYQILVNLAGPPAAAAAGLSGRYSGRWMERLGLADLPRRGDGDLFWFHAASVGEARSAAVVIKYLLEFDPAARVVLSVGTPAGLETAEALFKDSEAVSIMAAPYDFWSAPARTVRALKPKALIIWETELWPNIIAEAKKNGAMVVLAAGRLTARSFKRYRRVKTFMSDLLGRFDLIAPSGWAEYEYFSRLGAPVERLRILGNPKFDQLIPQADSDDFKKSTAGWHQKLWAGAKPAPLLVAGSTHRGEEEVLLKIFWELKNDYPALKLILAPRHLGRVPEVLELAGAAAKPVSSDGSIFTGSEVAVLDILGQLNQLYALSTIALVGGSFLPELTGHNPLEPAAVSRPIIFGPYMSSFQLEADDLLKAGAAVESRPEHLSRHLKTWLTQPSAAKESGLKARSILAARPPAAPALARIILKLAGHA